MIRTCQSLFHIFSRRKARGFLLVQQEVPRFHHCDKHLHGMIRISSTNIATSVTCEFADQDRTDLELQNQAILCQLQRNFMETQPFVQHHIQSLRTLKCRCKQGFLWHQEQPAAQRVFLSSKKISSLHNSEDKRGVNIFQFLHLPLFWSLHKQERRETFHFVPVAVLSFCAI